LAGMIAQVGFDISRKAGTNGRFILKENVYGSGVRRAAPSATGSGVVVPDMRSGKRLSGAVIAVPRRIKLCLQSSDVNSSPLAGLSSWGCTLVPARSLNMNSVWSSAGISTDSAKLLNTASSVEGVQE